MKFLTPLLLFIPPLYAKGPPNDDFSKAIILPDAAKITQEGSLTDKLDRFRATKQDDEPNHGGQKGIGSVWYSWTPETTRRVRIIAASENMNTLMAVYTGESVDNLTLVHRYQNFAFPAFSRKRTEEFCNHARVEFLAEAGTTYHFAIDSENAIYENFTLSLSPSKNPIDPELELMAPGGKWEFLLVTDDSGNPVDPKFLDPDFYYTWMFPKRYDGPRFTSGNAPIGYGEIDSLKLKSNILGKRDAEPPKGERHAAYLRTSFTPIVDVSSIGIEGIVDDGAIVYLNGREVARLNVTDDQNPQDWQTSAISAGKTGSYSESTELMIQYAVIENLNLKANVPVNLSLSMHNNNPNSSDMALDLRIYSISGKSEALNPSE